MDKDRADRIDGLRRLAEWLLQEARDFGDAGGLAQQAAICCEQLLTLCQEQLEHNRQGDRSKVSELKQICQLLRQALVCRPAPDGTHDELLWLRAANRALLLERSKLQNIFAATTNLVLVADHEGRVTRTNPAAAEFFAGRNPLGTPFWTLLEMTQQDPEGVLAAFPADGHHEIALAGGRHHFRLRLVTLQPETSGLRGFILVLNDISWLVDSRQELERLVAERTRALAESEQLLRQEKHQVEEMNVTLRNVMHSIDDERREFGRILARKVRDQLLPALDKIRREPSAEVRGSYLNLVREQLIGLTSGQETELDAHLLKLSKTEIRICRFIQAGCTSKEICDALNLAFETVQTHRKNIRRKLGLRRGGINLHAFLAARRPLVADEA